MAFLDNSGVANLVADLQAKIKASFAAKSHTHSADDVNRGILDFYRIPTGTTSTTVALGSHTHTSTLNAAGSVMASTAVEAGDKIVISDSSDYLRLKRSGIAFGSDTTTFLRNDGTWAAAGGGGGGVNKLILYTDSGETNLWIDQARTTTLFASYGYDYSVAKAALTDTDIIWVWNYSMDSRYLVVFWKIDTIDETFEIVAASGMGQIGSYGDFTRCWHIYIYQ